MKFVTVDDQLVDSTGKPLPNVPHLGMSATKIGNKVGQAIADEMKRRGWKPEEVGALRITNYELPTAKLRTDGATQALLANGFRKENIFDAPQKTTDDEGGFSAAAPVLARHPNVKKWVVYALNEETVLGAVRATEQLHIPAADVIGVGINGAGEAFAEFQKKSRRASTDDRRQLDEPRQGQHAEPRRLDSRRQDAAGRHADERQADDARELAGGARRRHLSARGENAMTTQTMTAVSGNDVAETPPGGRCSRSTASR